MEQLARVKQVYDDGKALVLCIRESACSGDCHKCSGCGAAQEAVRFLADNAIGAAPGDLVRVEGESAPVLKAAAVLYVLPLALFFLGYYLGARIDGWGAVGGGLGFALGIAAVVAYDRLSLSRQNMHYTITAFAHRGGATGGKSEETNYG